MKTLFLTSSISFVADDLAKKIDQTKYKRLVFITTASEAEEGDKIWQDNDRNALIDHGFEVFDYTLTGKTSEELKKNLSTFDIIHVSGGNTFYLLQQVQKSGFADFLRESIDQGKIYTSTSAGSQIVGPDIWPLRREEKPSPELTDYKGIGLVDFVVFPHWGSDHFNLLYLTHRININYNTDHKIMLLTDHQYIQVKDDWYQLVDVKNQTSA